MERRDMFAGGALIGAAGLALAATPSAAQAPASSGPSVLDRIIREKKIRITAEVTSPPFGILDRNNQPDGSEIATARRLAQDLGVELDLVQVTGPQRIPALLSGRADVAISSLSITLERAKTVAFANPHGALSIVITAPERVTIRNAADLAGKRIGITRATLEEATVPRSAPQGANIVFFDDIAATIQALLSGQVDAAGMSAFAAKSVADRNPRAGLQNKYTVTTAFYAPAVRPADHELRHWINTWIMLSKQNGVLAEIYERYTGVELVALPTI
ncbi:transporter substrate-binding domain-containing protein [Elioraea rosea]|uniref:transporter substrate-binding domain-containing protein n=1 Tax=Elioraea rosea TaxID=2492390 RepID=UPI001182C2AC|nr:transporter substrate-binding domain-containing protein [Elioraea rosea]